MAVVVVVVVAVAVAVEFVAWQRVMLLDVKIDTLLNSIILVPVASIIACSIPEVAAAEGVNALLEMATIPLTRRSLVEVTARVRVLATTTATSTSTPTGEIVVQLFRWVGFGLVFGFGFLDGFRLGRGTENATVDATLQGERWRWRWRWEER